MKPLKKCAFCGEPIHSLRFNYCSEECYTKAHRIQCRERFRRYYALNREEELARYRRRLRKQKAQETN